MAEKIKKVGTEEGDMKEENGDTEDDLLELMGKYHQGYSTETQLLQTYRMIFLALQAILFAGAFAFSQFSQVYEMGKMYVVVITGVSGIGIFFLFMWIIMCEERSDRAEEWRNEITNLTTTGKSPEAKFKGLCKRGRSLNTIRFCFNFLMPLILIVAWVIVWLILDI